jgi:hypothetical protein
VAWITYSLDRAYEKFPEALATYVVNDEPGYYEVELFYEARGERDGMGLFEGGGHSQAGEFVQPGVIA